MASALIVGTGLLGTSIGLALTAADWEVWLSDRDERAVRLAASLGAGEVGPPRGDPTVVVVATPLKSVAENVESGSRRYLSSIFIDISSTKTHVQREIEKLGLENRFLGTHPMAGRERSGPDAARSDLFDGRPWVMCPGPTTSAETASLIRQLVEACGARPIEMTPELHDSAVARVSHTPQVVASALAASLESATSGDLDLAGQGLRDTTRIAGSNPELWSQILESNAGSVAAVLDGIVLDLEGVSQALKQLASDALSSDISINRQVGESPQEFSRIVAGLLTRGRDGYSRIPGKHGAKAVEYAIVPVVIPDEPGELARLLTAAGEAGINVEDLTIEHVPGHPVGLVELLVDPGRAADLGRALTAMGWSVH